MSKLLMPLTPWLLLTPGTPTYSPEQWYQTPALKDRSTVLQSAELPPEPYSCHPSEDRMGPDDEEPELLTQPDAPPDAQLKAEDLPDTKSDAQPDTQPNIEPDAKP